METPTTLRPKRVTRSTRAKQPRRGTFYQLQVVFGVAFVLATLFTAWTPGQFMEDYPLESTSIAPGAIPTQQGEPSATPYVTQAIGIVAGHWQNDSGSVCPDGLREVDVNLNIASLVQKNLAERGYKVDLLQEFDPQLDGYKAAALVSIHADSCDFINNEATGFKVASAMATRHPEFAARLTACLRSRYGLATGLPLHSTSVTPDMTLYHAFSEIDEITPAAIIETGFLNLDRELLTQRSEVAAQGIADGIMCYIKKEPISPATEESPNSEQVSPTPSTNAPPTP